MGQFDLRTFALEAGGGLKKIVCIALRHWVRVFALPEKKYSRVVSHHILGWLQLLFCVARRRVLFP